MKKILLSALALIMSVNMFAITYTSEVTITMYDGTYFPNLILGESSDSQFAGGALVNGYYAPVQDLAGTPLSVYAYYNNAEYENLVLNSLTNVPMGIKTSAATSYTLYFTGLQGTMTIYDSKTDQTIDCSVAYPFTIEESEKNSIINDRFIINYVAPVKQICFNDEKLQLSKYAGAKVDVYLQGEAAPAKSETVASNALQEINLSDLAAGEYVVKIDLDGDAAIDEQYRITVKPTLSAYTPVVP